MIRIEYLFTLIHCCSLNGLFVDIPIVLPKPVHVHTPVGEIVGKLEAILFDDKQYDVKEFLGIPYAEPPVGNKRFRKPVSKAPFMSPFSALNYGASCLQSEAGGVGKTLQLSEDCLFLNVFVPAAVDPFVTKIPVMVWIHGGGFVSGPSEYYHSDRLSAFGQVIVVTINYRLAHLGFLQTNEGAGNFGLWDQHLAIKWVSENIGSFGGDVNNITIFGESAGSSSVVYQVLFPGNKNLFQRAIAESGGITSSWAFSTNEYASDIFANFTGEIGCKGSHEVIMTCLRNKTTDEIASIMKSGHITYLNIVPNRDDAFVPKHPHEMLVPSPDMKGALDVFYNIDFMMGSCSIDGALFLPELAAVLNITNLELFRVPRVLYESTFIPETIASVFSNFPNVSQVAKDAAVFEYTNWTDPNDAIARNLMLVDLITDSSMFAPMLATTQLHTAGTRRTYVYEFSTRPTTHLLPVPAWLDGPTQANHADDIFFVFGFTPKMIDLFDKLGLIIQVKADDIRAAKVVISMWTNFAKTG